MSVDDARRHTAGFRRLYLLVVGMELRHSSDCFARCESQCVICYIDYFIQFIIFSVYLIGARVPGRYDNVLATVLERRAWLVRGQIRL